MTRASLRRVFLRALAASPAAASLSACGNGLFANDRCGTTAMFTVDLATLDHAESAAHLNAGGVVPPEAGIPYTPDAGDFLDTDTCRAICPSCRGSWFCPVTAVQGGQVTVQCIADATGRRPAGLDRLGPTATFAELARLETASIEAFRRLRRELAPRGAPRSLLRRCSRAARDEVRHARVTRALARRHGQPFEAPRIAPAAPRSLESLAVENAVEGCVRETFGALLAGLACDTHADATVRCLMARIVRDEERHGALAWAVAAWLEPRLSSGARQRVRAARDAAFAELIREFPPALVRAATGLPAPAGLFEANYPWTAA